MPRGRNVLSFQVSDRQRSAKAPLRKELTRRARKRNYSQSLTLSRITFWRPAATGSSSCAAPLSIRGQERLSGSPAFLMPSKSRAHCSAIAGLDDGYIMAT